MLGNLGGFFSSMVVVFQVAGNYVASKLFVGSVAKKLYMVLNDDSDDPGDDGIEGLEIVDEERA